MAHAPCHSAAAQQSTPRLCTNSRTTNGSIRRSPVRFSGMLCPPTMMAHAPSFLDSQTAMPLFAGICLVAPLAMATAVLATKAGRREEPDSGSPKAQPPRKIPTSIELVGPKWRLTLHAASAPSGMGRVVLSPIGTVAHTSQDLIEFLESLRGFAREHKSELGKGFVAIFECTHMVFPGVWSIPRIVSAMKDQLPPQDFQDNTHAITVVTGDSRWLGKVAKLTSDVVVFLTRPSIVPVFASSQQSAEAMISLRGTA